MLDTAIQICMLMMSPKHGQSSRGQFLLYVRMYSLFKGWFIIIIITIIIIIIIIKKSLNS